MKVWGRKECSEDIGCVAMSLQVRDIRAAVLDGVSVGRWCCDHDRNSDRHVVLNPILASMTLVRRDMVACDMAFPLSDGDTHYTFRAVLVA